VSFLTVLPLAFVMIADPDHRGHPARILVS